MLDFFSKLHSVEVIESETLRRGAGETNYFKPKTLLIYTPAASLRIKEEQVVAFNLVVGMCTESLEATQNSALSIKSRVDLQVEDQDTIGQGNAISPVERL